jgi:hypothetical protein
MVVFPLVAAMVAFVFAGMLTRQFVARRRPYQLLWAISLAMYGVASTMILVGATAGWSRTSFQVYWVLGAVLTVPYLAAGELLLLVKNRSIHIVVWIVLAFVTAYTVFATSLAPTSLAALAERLPSGKEVLGATTEAYGLPRSISTPSYLILLGGVLWSAWKMRGNEALRPRFWGTLLIASGATVVAGFASFFAATGNLAGFSLALAVGVSMMFAGFLRASRPLAVPEVAVPVATATS